MLLNLLWKEISFDKTCVWSLNYWVVFLKKQHVRLQKDQQAKKTVFPWDVRDSAQSLALPLGRAGAWNCGCEIHGECTDERL